MFRLASVLLATFLLSACSTVVDSATQEITIETPGTGGALCNLNRPGHAMRVWAPKTVTITKSAGPLEIVCRAPGNLEKTVVLEPEIADSFMLNTFNGFLPGAAVDFDTGAMYIYPKTVVVDFSDMKPQKMPRPDYQRVLDENPELLDMEEFRPGVAALQRDRNYVAPPLRARRTDQELFSGGSMNADAAPAGDEGVSTTSAPAPVSAGAPAPYEQIPSVPVSSSGTSEASAAPAESQPSGGGSAADQLTRRMNPHVFGSASSGGSSAPVEIRPAQ